MAASSRYAYGNPTGNPSSSSSSSTASYSHAVCRSSELLSCAKTALKIAKSKAQSEPGPPSRNGNWWSQDPNSLRLCNTQQQSSILEQSIVFGAFEDGLSLLRAMEAELGQLEKLVRRRGHTNDPTEEIAISVSRLEADAKELATLVKTGFPRTGGKQYQKHLQLVASWLESVASKQTNKLKEILKVRGNVLADQAQRRKLLNPQQRINSGTSNNNNTTNGIGSTSNSAAAPPPPRVAAMSSSAFESPLFTMTQSTNPSYPKPTNGVTPARYGAGGYGGAASAGGYNGVGAGQAFGYGGGGLAQTGTLRQRKNATVTSSSYYSQQPPQQQEPISSSSYIQAQIQERQQQRQTESRLQEARQAERTLAELGTMFSKMSTLISSQGEILEKVEDDVEAAAGEVTLGQQEITNLYSIKKGNRSLILKVFGLLIFLIIFMRLYKK